MSIRLYAGLFITRILFRAIADVDINFMAFIPGTDFGN